MIQVLNKSSIFKEKQKQKFILLLCVFFLSLTKVSAQQTPHYSQYLYNMQVINPAYVGSRSDLSISVLSRDQWVGVAGAPTTRTFSINGRTYNGLGIGLTAINDNIGLAETTNVNLDLSYTILTSQYGRLAFGLKGGITFFNNNLEQGITPDNDINPSIDGQSPNVGFGAYYYTQKFFVGLSLPYLLKTSVFRTLNTQNSVGLNENMNYFLTTGAVFNISENILFKPSTLIKYATNLPVSIDLNTNFLVNNTFETGISYRYNDSVNALFAIVIKEKFRVGYTYDYKLGNFGNNLNTHEIILHIDFTLKRNTRWLLPNKCYF